MRNQRYLVGLGLIVIVAFVIIVARLLPHSSAAQLVQDTPPIADPGSSLISAAPGASVSPAGPLLHAPVAPVTKKGSSTPTAVAKAFGLAWLHHDGVTATAWLRGVTPYATSALATQLAATDPRNVPADRISGTLKLVNDTAITCNVEVPTDTGTLVLGMARVHDAWLVSAVDWDRA